MVQHVTVNHKLLDLLLVAIVKCVDDGFWEVFSASSDLEFIVILRKLYKIYFKIFK